MKLTSFAAEPFRLFFPLGILASFLGVLMWPAFFQGWIPFYPLEAHARMMVLGFGACFITGFLGTAGPRLLGSKPWNHRIFGVWENCHRRSYRGGMAAFCAGNFAESIAVGSE